MKVLDYERTVTLPCLLLDLSDLGNQQRLCHLLAQWDLPFQEILVGLSLPGALPGQVDPRNQNLSSNNSSLKCEKFSEHNLRYGAHSFLYPWSFFGKTTRCAASTTVFCIIISICLRWRRWWLSPWSWELRVRWRLSPARIFNVLLESSRPFPVRLKLLKM